MEAWKPLETKKPGTNKMVPIDYYLASLADSLRVRHALGEERVTNQRV